MSWVLSYILQHNDFEQTILTRKKLKNRNKCLSCHGFFRKLNFTFRWSGRRSSIITRGMVQRKRVIRLDRMTHL